MKDLCSFVLNKKIHQQLKIKNSQLSKCPRNALEH